MISKRTVLNDRLKVAFSVEGCYCGPLIAKLMEASVCARAPKRGCMCICGCLGALSGRASVYMLFYTKLDCSEISSFYGQWQANADTSIVVVSGSSLNELVNGKPFRLSTAYFVGKAVCSDSTERAIYIEHRTLRADPVELRMLKFSTQQSKLARLNKPVGVQSSPLLSVCIRR